MSVIEASLLDYIDSCRKGLLWSSMESGIFIAPLVRSINQNFGRSVAWHNE